MEEYVVQMNRLYCGENLTRMMNQVADMIGAVVLNQSAQDYLPYGASATVLVAEKMPEENLAFHLDKSHLTVHTYPDICEKKGIASFRSDIEVSTCGKLKPLKVLGFLMDQIDPDLVWIDYRIRGFTRDKKGNIHFTDQNLEQMAKKLKARLEDKYEWRQELFPELFQMNLRLCKKKEWKEDVAEELREIFR